MRQGIRIRLNEAAYPSTTDSELMPLKVDSANLNKVLLARPSVPALINQSRIPEMPRLQLLHNHNNHFSQPFIHP